MVNNEMKQMLGEELKKLRMNDPNDGFDQFHTLSNHFSLFPDNQLKKFSPQEKPSNYMRWAAFDESAWTKWATQKQGKQTAANIALNTAAQKRISQIDRILDAPKCDRVKNRDGLGHTLFPLSRQRRTSDDAVKDNSK